MLDPLNRIEDFLKVKKDFHLGSLTTEAPHPKSENLSELAKKNLYASVECCREIDLDALQSLSQRAKEIAKLGGVITQVLSAGNKVFLCGCGATGRLSLTLETLCRESLIPKTYCDQIISFMAGGDTALIRSIENFEDHPEYGRRQLLELGFGSDDLLIAITEGGETPFVIGATETATEKSNIDPWFVYCNPDEELMPIKRCQKVLENNKIQKLNLTVGPMTLSGSTRMQASSVQLLAIGLALQMANEDKGLNSAVEEIQRIIHFYRLLDLSPLTRIIEGEANIYLGGNRVVYQSSDFGMTVLTDTTERSPTFSLIPFENFDQNDPQSYCYFNLPETKNSAQAWGQLLKRKPRALEWESTREKTSLKRLLGFDISNQVTLKRANQNSGSKQYSYQIIGISPIISFLGIEWKLGLDDFSPLSKHLILKLILNTQSTIVMGRIGRYEGNLMTYVKASNLKLIDRATRYVLILAKKEEIQLSYENALKFVFEVKQKIESGELKNDSPVVLEALIASRKTLEGQKSSTRIMQ